MADSVFQNSGSVNTVIGAYNMLNAFIPLDYYPNLESTLNAKYNRFPTQMPPQRPLLQYFGVGIHGYYNNGDNDHVKYNPDPRNMDLYAPIPIRMVPLDNDLTSDERRLYRMRVVQTIGSQKYACYYLKKIMWDPSYVQLIQKGADGNETTYNLNPGTYLTPTAVRGITGGRMTVSDSHIIVRAVGMCVVTLKELSEAMSILYSKDYCIVSEWGYYTGCDMFVTSEEELIPNEFDMSNPPANAANIEAVYVQLSKHRCGYPKTLDSSESELTDRCSFESPEAVEV